MKTKDTMERRIERKGRNFMTPQETHDKNNQTRIGEDLANSKMVGYEFSESSMLQNPTHIQICILQQILLII